MRQGSAKPTARKPATAKVLRRALQKQGVETPHINASHILETYNQLKVIRGVHDVNLIASVLDALQPEVDRGCDVLGVIVETRRHRHLGRVMNNLLSLTNMPVQLFHGISNADFAQAQIPPGYQDRVHLSRLETDDLGQAAYNALLLSEAFWQALIGRRKILVFQTDSLLCAGSEFQLKDFIDFDYIGAAWPRLRPVGIVVDGGIGGLSLRDWAASVDALRRFPPKHWTGAEDGYFGFHLDLMGHRVAGHGDSAAFCTQYRFRKPSWGVHNPTFLSAEDRARFLTYCPDAEFLFEARDSVVNGGE